MKTLKFTLYTAVVCAGLLSSSCRKYVEIETYGTRTLKSTTDYQYVVNNRNNFQNGTIMPIISNDDISTQPSAAAISQWGIQVLNAYLWAENFYNDDQQDIGYNNMYKQIYLVNEILKGVMDSENGKISQKQQIAAEAKVHRAFAYYCLVNQYAPIYNPETAATQPGMPLLLNTDLFQDLSRASLQSVYEQIIDDLVTSIEALPAKPQLNHHPSKLAAYTLLSRVYLTMRNFTEAGRYGELALSLNPTLTNVASYTGSSYPNTQNDPEIILSKLSAGVVTGPLNQELIDLYDAKDLRLTYLIERNALLEGYKAMKSTRSGSFFSEIGLGAPEVYLNQAEVYARANNADKVLEMLNTLRENRFTAVDYVPLTIADLQGDLLQAVINERRREFVGSGMRWYDMRRLTLDGNYFRTVTRQANGQTVTLQAGSPRFLFPINHQVLTLNPEIGQNPR